MRKLFASTIAITFLLLTTVLPAYSQSQNPQQRVVLIRNIVMSSESDGATVDATVKVVDGSVVRVSDSAPAPAGALVIDGGGSRLTIPYNTSMPFEGQKGLGDTAISSSPTTGTRIVSCLRRSVFRATTSRILASNQCGFSSDRNTTSKTSSARENGPSRRDSR